MPKKRTAKQMAELAAARAKRTTEQLERKIALDQRRLRRAIEKLERQLIREFSALSVARGGNLLGPRTNLTQAMRLHKDMLKIWEQEYGAIVRENTRDFRRLETLIQQNYRSLRVPGAAAFTSIDKKMIDQLKTRVMGDFTTIGQAAQDRITQGLFDMIAAQSPMDDFINIIKGALTGHVDIKGRPLASYAEVYANDAVMNFYNLVHVEKGRAAGLQEMLYVGSVMKNTRDFCLERVGKVFTIEEINSWDHDWSGKRGPALIYRGGWNCRHTWQPVENEWVEELEDIYGPPANTEREED